ncbi:subtilisin-like protein [Cadophora sp. DSE1049]|nr:subtilisin-like protein [Cadophora sp. DSE1049]
MDSRSVTPVKVAVLDTGCDMDAFCFTSSGSGQDERLEGRWLDFVGKEKNPVDEDLRKHGTAMTTLLMRLLPISTAEIYVARVARDSKGLLGAQDNIANAITHACQTWKVDVVSMSFGFPNDTTDTSKIQRAMSDAENSRDCKVLFFAAANNDGLHEPEMFPASSESVISVRGTDHSGGFITRYNPTTWPHKRGNLYGTLSENVPCDWDCGRSIQSGCSVATPIVAAIAANMICFVSNRSIELEVREVDLMRTRKGILSVFDVFTTNQQDRTGIQRYLAPHRLLNRDDMKSTIPYALSRSRVPSGG